MLVVVNHIFLVAFRVSARAVPSVTARFSVTTFRVSITITSQAIVAYILPL
jgi:hypothetical protein